MIHLRAAGGAPIRVATLSLGALGFLLNMFMLLRTPKQRNSRLPLLKIVLPGLFIGAVIESFDNRVGWLNLLYMFVFTAVGAINLGIGGEMLVESFHEVYS
jgi:hypothetical protein